HHPVLIRDMGSVLPQSLHAVQDLIHERQIRRPLQGTGHSLRGIHQTSKAASAVGWLRSTRSRLVSFRMVITLSGTAAIRRSPPATRALFNPPISAPSPEESTNVVSPRSTTIWVLPCSMSSVTVLRTMGAPMAVRRPDTAITL